MKNFFGGIFIVIVFAAWAITNSGATSTSASPLDLPAVKRTEVYADAHATQQAGVASSQSALAKAQADEAEAARVYVQAATDERNKARTVATEQSVLATKTTNDVAVSKEYATLAAVSLQATAQAISNTIETDRVAYAARQAEIMATKQATIDDSLTRAEQVDGKKEHDAFWLPFWRVVAIVVALLIAIAAYRLISRIGPSVTKKEIEALSDKLDDARYEIEALRRDDDEADPERVLDVDAARKVEAWQRDHALAIRYVADSARKNAISAPDKLLTASEWEALGSARDDHGAAVAHLRALGYIRTQQGGPPERQGTFVQESGKDLLYLLSKLYSTAPPL